jgi:hypothetical protein
VLLSLPQLALACCPRECKCPQTPREQPRSVARQQPGEWNIQHDNSATRPQGSTSANTTNDSRLLRLVIARAEAPPYSQGAIRITMNNNSSEWLWVSYSLGIGLKNGPRGNMWLEIFDATTGKPAGGWYCSTAHGVQPGAPKGSYIDLGPGDAFSTTARLDCLGLPHRGPWRFVAHYQDASRNPSPSPLGSSWFTGELVSNVLEMEVKDAPTPRNAPSRPKPHAPNTSPTGNAGEAQ